MKPRNLVRAVQLASAVAVGVLVAVVPAAAASAHPGGVQAATDYRTRVTGIYPPVPGMHLHFVDEGS